MALNFIDFTNAGGQIIHAENFRVKIPASLTSAALYNRSLLVAGTGGFKAAADNATAIIYLLDHLYDQYGRNVTQQGLTSTELAANDYYAEVYDVSAGKLQMIMGEDGVGGIIVDPTVTPFCNIVNNAASTIDKNALPEGGDRASIQIDSSSANASATGKAVQIIASDPNTDAAQIATTAPKNYLVKFL